jgi:hypothetical protein
MLVADIVTDVPFCLSDHDSLLFSIYSESDDRNSNSEKGAHVKLAWNRVNWEELGNFYFETDWDTVFAPEQDANTLWSNLTSVLNRGILSHVPLIRVTNRSRKNAHSKKTMNLIRKKKLFWKKSKAKPNKKSLRYKYKLWHCS